jgi:hypothetical protein
MNLGEIPNFTLFIYLFCRKSPYNLFMMIGFATKNREGTINLAEVPFHRKLEVISCLKKTFILILLLKIAEVLAFLDMNRLTDNRNV